ncbi:MAG: DUF4097 family beta strand repeat protein [Chloroflexi bacterium]|nr:DUF4097 family beta strand repeat protein [Chloroflexota bacterium]
MSEHAHNLLPFVEETDQSFELADLVTAQVSVSNVSGPITIAAWDQPGAHLHAVKRAGSQRVLDATRIVITQAGDQITARTVIDEDAIRAEVMGFLRGERTGAVVEYRLQLPAACAARVKTVNGSVTISGLSHQVEANAVNGAVTLTHTGGTIHAETVNGALKAEQIAGRAHLSTVSGSLELREASPTDLEARTVNGDIRAQLTIEAGGHYTFNSTNGNCQLTIPADSRCAVEMEAINGGGQRIGITDKRI